MLAESMATQTSIIIAPQNDPHKTLQQCYARSILAIEARLMAIDFNRHVSRWLKDASLAEPALTNSERGLFEVIETCLLFVTGG